MSERLLYTLLLLLSVCQTGLKADSLDFLSVKYASDDEVEEVLVAKRDLVAGHKVEPADFTTIRLPRKYFEDQYVKDYREIDNLYLRSNVSKYSYISFKFLSRDRTPNTIHLHVPEGQRAVETIVYSSTALHAGDRIALKWIESKALGDLYSSILGTNIEILSVSHKTDSSRTRSILVSAPPEVVNKIILARLNGKLIAEAY